MSAAEDLKIPTVHLLVLGVQAPTVVPQTVTKIQHIVRNNNTATAGKDDDQLYTAIEDAIAGDAPCTHILMASKGDGEPTGILTQANKRFVSCLVPDVVAIESRGTFLVLFQFHCLVSMCSPRRSTRVPFAMTRHISRGRRQGLQAENGHAQTLVNPGRSLSACAPERKGSRH